jgi:dTDP-4-dehydrorhamnose 3,5-epimerase
VDNLILEGIKVPTLILGKNFVDNRGTLQFINGLGLSEFRRFYIIQNHATGFVRAWHGHLKEAKVFFPITGSFLIGAVKLSTNAEPLENEKPECFVLSDSNPQGLCVPAGYSNGSMSLTPEAKLLVFSSTTLEESQGDDYRHPYDQWNIWNVEAH